MVPRTRVRPLIRSMRGRTVCSQTPCMTLAAGSSQSHRYYLRDSMLAVPDRTGDRALYSIVKELDDLKNLRPQRGGHGDPRRMSRKWREHSYEEPVALSTLPKHNEEQYERRVSIIYVPPLCEIPATPAMRKSLLRPISLSVRSVSYTNKLRRKFSSASGTSLSRRSTTGSSNRFGIPKVLKRTRTCVVCQSAIDGTRVRVPCGHYLDIPCFMHLVDKSAHDESLFPPSCCRQAIPDRTLRHYLPPPLIEVLADKGREFSATKRVYCSNPPCSRFLGPRTEDSPPQVLTCTACTTQTCSACRERVRAHKPHRCGRDRAQRELLALANQKGWARCPACEHMIELRSGCYHMTCICATQFCYLCRSPWKTCDCPQWEVMQIRDVGEGLSLDRPLSGLRVALRTETAAKKPESKADRPKRSGQTVARPISRVQSEKPPKRSSQRPSLDIENTAIGQRTFGVDDLLYRGMVAQSRRGHLAGHARTLSESTNRRTGRVGND